MDSSLHGKVALVTGGAVRIGRAIVRRLMEEGCRVVVHYHRSAPAARELEEAGCALVRGDLSTRAGCARVVKEARRAFGRLDILVNSAARFNRQPLARLTERTLIEMFRVNLFAPVFLTQAFAASARSGLVVNLLDRRIAAHDPACLAYALSKKALADFTGTAALALAPRIRVNAVAPGPVLPPPGRGPAYLRAHAGRLPLVRPPAVEDVAGAVVALARSPATTGQILFVDGGQHLLGNGV